VAGSLEDVLKDDDKKKVDVTTDEIEEKGEAVEMMLVFMKKTGAGFAPYIQDAAKCLCEML
jgi:hypothetical protein